MKKPLLFGKFLTLPLGLRKRVLWFILAIMVAFVVQQPTVAQDEEITLPTGFVATTIFSGSPLGTITGLVVSQDGKLYVSDAGTSPGKIHVINFAPWSVNTLVSGQPLGAPARLLIGNGSPLVGADLIVADWNSEVTVPCCVGRVFRIDRNDGTWSVLATGNFPPLGVVVGDPFGLALMGPGGSFGEGLYVMDFMGNSTKPPFLSIVHSDLTRTLFLSSPLDWTVDTMPLHIEFGTEAFGYDLYVADAAWTHAPYNGITTPTIWRVTPSASLSVFAQDDEFKHPVSLRFGPGGAFGTDMYVLDMGDEAEGGMIFKVSTGGDVSTFASGLPYFAHYSDFVFSSDGECLFVGIGDEIIKICPEVPRVIEVEIDIKPGSDPNCFNIDGHGNIPVAILGSADFDVLDIDFTTLSFAGLAVRVRGKRGPMCSFEDSNSDLFLDLVCHFEDDSSEWAGGTSSATVIGKLLDGTDFEGTDSICIVKIVE